MAVLHGLSEFICPARRFGTWVVYPRVRAWRSVSSGVGLAVVARSGLGVPRTLSPWSVLFMGSQMFQDKSFGPI